MRDAQPLMATGYAPMVEPDPLVRVVRPDELDVVLPACIAMFTEEVGVSPLLGDGGAAYRARVSELVSSGRAFARIEDGRVVFKAEVGVVSSGACQVQGVWVDPSRRGEGLAAAGMAAVVRACLQRVRPGRLAVRQQLQPPGARDLCAGGLLAGRHLRDRPVLTAAKLG